MGCAIRPLYLRSQKNETHDGTIPDGSQPTGLAPPIRIRSATRAAKQKPGKNHEIREFPAARPVASEDFARIAQTRKPKPDCYHLTTDSEHFDHDTTCNIRRLPVSRSGPALPGIALVESFLSECPSPDAARWRDRLQSKAGWDPFAFVDLCESCANSEESELALAARRIQLAEMALLLEFTRNAS